MSALTLPEVGMTWRFLKTICADLSRAPFPAHAKRPFPRSIRSEGEIDRHRGGSGAELSAQASMTSVWTPDREDPGAALAREAPLIVRRRTAQTFIMPMAGRAFTWLPELDDRLGTASGERSSCAQKLNAEPHPCGHRKLSAKSKRN